MSPRLTDLTHDLLAEARGGSPVALGALYERYAPLVARVAYRVTGSMDDAEDVLQDVFVGLPEALRKFEGRGSFDGWIHRVATRTALMRLRRERQSAAMPELLDSRSPTSAGIAARLTLEAALLRLPDALRLVFVLREMEGYSHAEIGSMLGIRAGTSEVRLHRAVRQLRAYLENDR